MVPTTERPDFNILLETTLTQEKRAMLSLISRALKGVDPQDVLHDVVVKALAAQGRYNAEKTLATWLWVMLKNHIVDLQRKASIRQGEVTKKALDSYPDTSTSDPESMAIALEADRKVQAALAAMPPEQAGALCMRMDGATTLEIAEHQKANPDTAKSRTFYALKKVRAALKEKPRRTATSPSTPPQ